MMYEDEDFTGTVSDTFCDPTRIGIMPKGFSGYYAWYDDGNGRSFESHLLDFSIDREWSEGVPTIHMTIHMLPFEKETYKLEGEAFRWFGGGDVPTEEQRLELAFLISDAYVQYANKVRTLHEEYHQTIVDRSKPDYVDALKKRVSIRRIADGATRQAEMNATKFKRINDKLNTQLIRPEIDYSRKW